MVGANPKLPNGHPHTAQTSEKCSSLLTFVMPLVVLISSPWSWSSTRRTKPLRCLKRSSRKTNSSSTMMDWLANTTSHTNLELRMESTPCVCLLQTCKGMSSNTSIRKESRSSSTMCTLTSHQHKFRSCWSLLGRHRRSNCLSYTRVLSPQTCELRWSFNNRFRPDGPIRTGTIQAVTC